MLKEKEEEIEGFGYFDYHEEPIDESKYKWKCCWGCYHFREGKDFPYTFMSLVSEELGVSESTVRRWIKKGKLKCYLFKCRRYTVPPKKYHIEKKSVEEMKKKK